MENQGRIAERTQDSGAQRRLPRRRTLTGARRPDGGRRKSESSGILKKFRGRYAGLKAQGGWASRPPRGGFVGGTPTLLEGTVFYNSRAKAGRCPRMGEKGTGLPQRHGATEKIRCSHGSPLPCNGKRGSPKGPANDANPREWKTKDWMGLRGVAPHSPSTPPDMRFSASGG
jgi:hypothetical protein